MVFGNYNKYGPSAAKKFGRGFYGQSFLAGFAGGFVKGAVGSIFSDIEKGMKSAEHNLSFMYIGGAALGGDYTKKIVAKSINKEYKLYLSKNSGFDSSPLNNFFIQTLAYMAGYPSK